MLATSKLLNQVQSHVLSGRLDAARQLLVRPLQQSPADPGLNSAMCAVLSQLGQFEGALYYADRCIQMAPHSAGMYMNLGNVLAMSNRTDEAVAAYRKAVELEPRNAVAWTTLSRVLTRAHRYGEAETVLRAAMQCCPLDISTQQLYSQLRLYMGEAGECVRLQADLLSRDPSNRILAGLLPYSMCYAPDIDPGAHLDSWKTYGKVVAQHAGPPYASHANSKDPERTLVVGMVTGDLRAAAFSRFAEPLFRATDTKRIRWIAYSTANMEDHITDRLRPLVSRWRKVTETPEREIAEMVRRDEVDVLIDGAGLTHGHRHVMFAMRPAPVQITWLGLPASTGLSAIGYRLVDAITDPPGFERWSTEKLLRIKGCMTCYAPPGSVADFPLVPPPSQRADSPTRGRITFGSYSTVQKLHDGTLRVWGRILDRVPGSTLVMRHTALRDATTRERLLARFRACGADMSRVFLEEPARETRELLPQYARLDIALDTWPYNGHTTTCEALYMGVPVVTRVSPTSAGRVGLSLLTSIGMSEFAAADDDAYVEAAVALASDGERLTQLRSTLRSRFLACPAGNEAYFARAFEEQIRVAWHEWCGSAEPNK